ncbi:MAG TPA: non-homologous end-joining DNA ligase [Actinomycetota bacterium]|nr:non-homologous end-joining DNA ligase [Actinomycetota bacterium]
MAARRRQPKWVQPMLATLTRNYFSDPDWVFEPKLDGIRCIAFKSGKDVRLLSRNKLEHTARHPELVDVLRRQKSDFILDGEIAASVKGKTSFSLLQQAFRQTVKVHYFVFDIMHLDGRDVRRRDLLARKELLRDALKWADPLTYVEHIVGEGEAAHREACKLGLEGVMAKRIGSPYVAGRSRDWLKFKCSNEQELVIGGYTDPQGAREAFGALLVGYYEDGELHYAGKVGTGFNAALLHGLLAEMKPLEIDESPFAGKPPLRKNVHWLKPKLVAQVGFAEWTGDGRLRHPRFIGLRRDKKAKDVVREG